MCVARVLKSSNSDYCNEKENNGIDGSYCIGIFMDWSNRRKVRKYIFVQNLFITFKFQTKLECVILQYFLIINLKLGQIWNLKFCFIVIPICQR